MKRIIPLSIIAVASLYASDVTLPDVNVEATTITEVSQNAQVSADLAQALSESVPSVDMNRRSGIANDIYIRGQKRDNISVEVDGTKVCGACVNRMDPPVSHILTNQIDEIEVIEGPYDVTTFGTMSGGVKITTKQPTQKLHGEVDFGLGSWNYRKVGATASGGNDRIRVLVSGSSESSDQYRDGDGRSIAQQIRDYATGTAVAGTMYKPQYQDMKAYQKNSLMTKAFVSIAKDQELRLSYTANRSTNVLYGNSKMDALYDDSNIYSVEYNVDNLSDKYKNLNLQYYSSDVDHPMATKYRLSSNNPAMDNTNHLKTKMIGVKLKNTFNIKNYKLLVGLDTSKRTWDGNYYKTTTKLPLPAGNSKSIDNGVTKNNAIFAKLDRSYGDISFSLGARYDSTNIDNNANLKSNDYTGLSANLLTKYALTKQSTLFLGFGQANRVPDARELYFTASNGALFGTPDLDQTTNQEVDLGYETQNENFTFKIKGFYSKLNNYIYYNKDLATNKFVNIDATVYGAELTASVFATDELSIDASMSYKKGEKDKALAGQTDKDLADMAPLRTTLAANYEYMPDSMAKLEIMNSQKWSNYDADNGEQELDGWTVVNVKVKHAVNKNMDFTVGINNLFDETYAVSNTYYDLTLIAAGTDDVMLMNEPGRYVYTNMTLKF